MHELNLMEKLEHLQNYNQKYQLFHKNLQQK